MVAICNGLDSVLGTCVIFSKIYEDFGYFCHLLEMNAISVPIQHQLNERHGNGFRYTMVIVGEFLSKIIVSLDENLPKVTTVRNYFVTPLYSQVSRLRLPVCMDGLLIF